MRTIWKVGLAVMDEQAITLPDGARFLCVDAQRETPCLWASVDPDRPNKGYTIYTLGTGQNDPDGVSLFPHLGTYQLVGGNFVGHVFCADA